MTCSAVSRRDVLRWARKLGLAMPALGLAACGRGTAERRLTVLTGATMGTTYSVKMTDLPRSIDVVALHAGITRLLQTVHDQMSTYQVDSELSHFNASTSTEWYTVSPETLMVIDEALRVSRLCDGAFDVTVGPLVNLWGFGPERRRAQPPADRDIQAALNRVGFRGLHTRSFPPAVRKNRADISVDLSAIAKGYGIDKLGSYLESWDIEHYLVEIGGELRARGHNVQGEPWKIGLEKPVSGSTALQRIVRLYNGVLATSGDYRNYFETYGRRYTHIIHPRTGEPIVHNLAAVSLIGQSTMLADALTTALMALGPEAGFDLAEREQLAALFVVRDGSKCVEIPTSAFAPYAVQA